MVLRSLTLTLIGFFAGITGLQAAIIATITESGSDVLMDFEGSLDLTDINLTSSALTNAGVFEIPSGAYFGGLNPSNPSSPFSVDPYIGITGPTTFFSSASNGFLDADSTSGDFFGIIAGGGVTTPGIYVDLGYVSKSVISGTATLSNTTLSNLNLVEGVYTWNWGSGATADFVELTVGTPIPEPRYASLLIALLVLGFLYFKRKQKLSPPADLA